MLVGQYSTLNSPTHIKVSIEHLTLSTTFHYITLHQRVKLHHVKLHHAKSIKSQKFSAPARFSYQSDNQSLRHILDALLRWLTCLRCWVLMCQSRVCCIAESSWLNWQKLLKNYNSENKCRKLQLIGVRQKPVIRNFSTLPFSPCSYYCVLSSRLLSVSKTLVSYSACQLKFTG